LLSLCDRKQTAISYCMHDTFVYCSFEPFAAKTEHLASSLRVRFNEGGQGNVKDRRLASKSFVLFLQIKKAGSSMHFCCNDPRCVARECRLVRSAFGHDSFADWTYKKRRTFFHQLIEK
jgi:hypothetical protein